MSNLKKILLFLCLIFALICNIYKVNAEITKIGTTCNIGVTDGLLFPNGYNFTTIAMCKNAGKQYKNLSNDTACLDGKYEIFWTYRYGMTKICPATGCTDDSWTTPYDEEGNQLTKGLGMDNLFKSKYFYNVYAEENTNNPAGVYTNEKLKIKIEDGACPEYMYVASSKSKQKFAFIFSSKKINNAEEILTNAGFTVEFKQNGAGDLNEAAKKNYENQVQKMKDNIQKFKDNNWGQEYNEECSKLGMFGGFYYEENLMIEYYEKYKKELKTADSDYDFSAGEKVLEEYKTMDCAGKPTGDVDLEKIEYRKVTCETLFMKVDVNGVKHYNDTHKLLSTALKFMQYLAVTLALILSIVDFIKVVPSKDKAELKKSAMKAVTRLIIAVIIFIIPILLDFLLKLVGFNNSICGLL